jgi:SPP1 family predicted phage head-tail adaptor
MALDPGRLRERVTIQHATEKRNALGETTLEWATFAERWASVDGISAREFFLSGQQQTEVTHRVRLRYVAGLNGTMRVVWRGRVLEIASCLEHANRSEHELLCTERVD